MEAIISLRVVIFLLCLGWALSSDPLGDASWNPADIITRDVAIIGGGSSGTYAAIRLRDMKQSVIVVERTNRLGGHTETFIDPVTKTPIDIGVVFWENLDIVKNYASRFNVTLKLAFATGGAITYVDFRTGAIVPNFSPPNPIASLAGYAAQYAKYPYLESGFDLPNPIPPDLLLPFGDFVTKYNISAAVSVIFGLDQGIGDILSVPTLYAMKLCGFGVLQALQTGFLAAASGDNSELYVKAQAVLSSAHALLLESTIVRTSRPKTNGGYVRIIVSTPSGLKLIKAKKVLLTIPPTLKNLDHFDLDATERSLFSQFKATGYYTAILRGGGIPDSVSIQNIGKDTRLNLPTLPGIYGIFATGVPGLHKVLYGSQTMLSDNKVKDDIVGGVLRLRTAGSFQTTTPEFAVYSSHAPFEFTVAPSAIEAGFYHKLNALQGNRHTFYTGAAFHTHNSALLWEFTEALLPRIVA